MEVGGEGVGENVCSWRLGMRTHISVPVASYCDAYGITQQPVV